MNQDKLLELIEKDIDDLIYKKPKCDFEHIWNCAVVQCSDVVTSFKTEEEFLELDVDKFKPTYEFGEPGKNDKHKHRKDDIKLRNNENRDSCDNPGNDIGFNYLSSIFSFHEMVVEGVT